MTDPAPSPPPALETTGRARSGCGLFGILGVFMLAAVGWFLFSGYQQMKEVAEFTEETAPSFPAETFSPEQISALHEKTGPFAAKIRSGEVSEIRLTIEDLRILLASAPELEPFRPLFQLTGLDAEKGGVVVKTALPMKSFPWKPNRVLAGTAILKPQTTGARFWVTLSHIAVPGKVIPEGFQRNLESVNLTDTLPREAGDLLHRITEISVEADALVLKSTPPGR